MIVLDASAVLAFLFGEPGGAAVGELLPQSMISAVNLSEVLSRQANLGRDPDRLWAQMQHIDMDVVPFAEGDALAGARLRPATDRFGLSFADRACLVLARARQLPVLTADRAWAKLDLGIGIRLIR